MSEDYNPAEALSELGYGKKSGGGSKVAIIVLTLLLLGAIGAAVYLAKRWSDIQTKMLVIERKLDEAGDKLSEADVKNGELSSLLAERQAENERIKEEWAAQIEMLKTQHTGQLRRTYGQLNEIVYDSRKTLAYIGDIETRLRAGQSIDKEEAAKLSNVINGLAFLYEKYKKPMSEFREVDRYISRQLAAIPASSEVDPRETTPTLQRIFKNKQFKKAQATYNRDKGKKEALIKAKAEVQAAYARAQSQMRTLNFDKNKYLTQLDKIVESNQNSAQDVEDFFNSSKEILKIHDKIMNIKTPQPPPTVKP